VSLLIALIPTSIVNYGERDDDDLARPNQLNVLADHRAIAAFRNPMCIWIFY
jgi:hypothetical protein